MHLVQVCLRVLVRLASLVCIHVGMGSHTYALLLAYSHVFVCYVYMCVHLAPCTLGRCGGRWTRTTEAVRRQSYNLLQLLLCDTPIGRGIGIPFVSVLRVVATYPISEGAGLSPPLGSSVKQLLNTSLLLAVYSPRYEQLNSIGLTLASHLAVGAAHRGAAVKRG